MTIPPDFRQGAILRSQHKKACLRDYRTPQAADLPSCIFLFLTLWKQYLRGCLAVKIGVLADFKQTISIYAD
jgi:hypothetical protein